MPEISEDSAQNKETIKEASPNEVLQAPELRLLLQDLRLSRLEGSEKPKKDSSSLRLTILGGIGTLILATANNFSNWYSNLSLEESK